MPEKEQPNVNKIIVAIAVFFLVGMGINLFLNYNQTTILDKRETTEQQILKKLDENLTIIQENTRQIESINNRLNKLENKSLK